jgi:type IV pilus assembly protein PilC
MLLLIQNPQTRELLFTELAQLADTGVPMSRVAEIMAGRRSALSQGLGRHLQAGLQRNAPIPEALRPSLDAMEYAVVAAGDASGQLPEAFTHLAQYYHLLVDTRRSLRSAIAYPLMVLNLACVVAAIIATRFNGNGIVESALQNLGLLWGGVALLLALNFVCDKLAAKQLAVDVLLRRIPFSGKARRALAWSRWCLAAHFQMLAGQNYGVACAAGGEASQSAVLDQFSDRVAQRAKRGEEIGPVFLHASSVPQMFSSAVATAEIAGRMDEVFSEWARRFQSDARVALDRMALWLPKGVLLIGALATGYIVIGFYQKLFSMDWLNM